MGLRYGEFNWEVVQTDFTLIEGDDEEVKVPSLFLEFDDDREENQLLQIISKQVRASSSVL